MNPPSEHPSIPVRASGVGGRLRLHLGKQHVGNPIGVASERLVRVRQAPNVGCEKGRPAPSCRRTGGGRIVVDLAGALGREITAARLADVIFKTKEVTQTAVGHKDGLWTTVVAAAILLP